LVVLALIPTLCFAVPALFNHPALNSDNLIQNFPLRVMSGRQMASGHLPLIDPLAYSGTPLLGGMNAGSFYPLTFLFVFLPPIAAWVINLVVIYVTAAFGMYALLRWLGIGPSGSFVAAISFSYAGAMVGHLVHIAVIQGYALIPWMTLVQLSLGRRLLESDARQSFSKHLRACGPSIIALAVMWGLACLSGEPRSIAELELLTVVIVTVAVLVYARREVKQWRNVFAYVSVQMFAATWGFAIAMVQLVVGWAFISQSQRSAISYSFFGMGSFPPRQLAMLFVPQIFGGNGSFGQPSFSMNYPQLPELMSYVGLVAFLGLSTFFAHVTRRGWPSDMKRFSIFAVLAVVGLITALGTYTPFGFLLHAIPLIGKTRLQSRNIVLFDFGAAALAGWFVQSLIDRHRVPTSLNIWRRYLSLSPGLLVVALLSVALCIPTGLLDWMVGTRGGNVASHLRGAYALQLLVAVVVLIVVRRRASFGVGKWLIAVCSLDLVVSLLLTAVSWSTVGVNPMPSARVATSVLGSAGRFAIINPTLNDQTVIENLGVPNINVFTGRPSIQGYGSLIQAQYGLATEANQFGWLNPCQLQSGKYEQLRLATVIISSTDLLSTAMKKKSPQLRCAIPLREPSHTALLGVNDSLSKVQIAGWLGESISTTPVTVDVLSSRGRVLSTLRSAPGATMRWNLFIAHGVSALRFHSSAGVRIGTIQIVNSLGAVQSLTTPFEQALGSSKWVFYRQIGPLTILHATSIRPSLQVVHPSPTTKVSSYRIDSWGDEWIKVSSPRAFSMTRSVAWLAGWRATLTDERTNVSSTLDVRPDGLIQRITVPAGAWRIHFHYHAPHIEAGLIVSTVACGLLIVAVVVALLRRRRTMSGRV
jgi:hypothetical protein